jgi:hypothetical protein
MQQVLLFSMVNFSCRKRITLLDFFMLMMLKLIIGQCKDLGEGS